MKYILKNQEMQQVDQTTIEKLHVPGLELMEQASMEVAKYIKNNFSKHVKIISVAGIGNNGGDALAAARILVQDGYQVDYCIIGNEEKASSDLLFQKDQLEALKLKRVNTPFLNQYNVIIDGIFGVGLTRNIEGIYKDVIEQINDTSAYVVAVDIPSGISGDTGEVLGCAIKANASVTFGGYKRGHLLYPGKEYCGEITLAQIGFATSTIEQFATAFTIDKHEKVMPKRVPNSNKGTYGKVLIVAGNETMSGAACLSAEATYRMGVGLVKVISPNSNRQILQIRLPEVLFGTRDQLLDSINWCDTILFGPGVGMDEDAKDMLSIILKYGTKPLVIDADGLNLISKYRMDTSNYKNQLVITPHLLEAARLLHCDISNVQLNLSKAAKQLGDIYDATVILKDATTLVYEKNERLYINSTGNNGMSTGGSGDVLGGMIAALVAMESSVFKAAVHGVFLHGLAGDYAKEEKGTYSMLASDIINHIPDVTK